MDQRVGGPNPLEAFEFCAKRVDSVCDERQKKPVGFMGCQCLDCPSNIIGRQVGALEIHACESVDLNIEETRWH
jgi:hypothetical protein